MREGESEAGGDRKRGECKEGERREERKENRREGKDCYNRIGRTDP